MFPCFVSRTSSCSSPVSSKVWKTPRALSSTDISIYLRQGDKQGFLFVCCVDPAACKTFCFFVFSRTLLGWSPTTSALSWRTATRSLFSFSKRCSLSSSEAHVKLRWCFQPKISINFSVIAHFKVVHLCLPRDCPRVILHNYFSLSVVVVTIATAITRRCKCTWWTWWAP